MLIEDYFDDDPIPGCDCEDCARIADEIYKRGLLDQPAVAYDDEDPNAPGGA